MRQFPFNEETGWRKKEKESLLNGIPSQTNWDLNQMYIFLSKETMREQIDKKFKNILTERNTGANYYKSIFDALRPKGP